jgi:metal transporter CNNM
MVNMLKLLVRLVVILPLAARSHRTINEISARNERISQAAELLESAGITGLCHPHSDKFAPDFPRCGAVQQDNVSSSTQRKLEYSYDYIDDNVDKNDNEGVYYVTEDEYQNLSGTYSTSRQIFDAVAAFFCVFIAALSSGLTVGLLGYDPLLLSIKMRAGNTEEEREQAATLVPIVKQHHLLLCTLLLMTSVAGEALPIFLHELFGELAAVFISVILVLFFGEILPSAYFTGPRQLRMAARCAPAVRFFMWALYPVAMPIAKILDMVLDSENESGNAYNRGELSALIRIQYEERLAAKAKRKNEMQDILPTLQAAAQPDENINGAEKSNPLLRPYKPGPLRSNSIHLDEVTMVEGALQLKTKFAVDIFVSFHKVFCVSMDTMLDETGVVNIYSSGYSRVPVFEGGDSKRIKGILLTRQLIVVNTNDAMPVSRMPLYIPQCVAPDENLVDLINLFQTGGRAGRVGHMALVCARPDIGNAALENDEPLPNEAGLMGYV